MKRTSDQREKEMAIQSKREDPRVASIIVWRKVCSPCTLRITYSWRY